MYHHCSLIKVYGTEGRYATALYSAASKQKALDAVEKDLKTFGEALKKDTRSVTLKCLIT